MTKNEQVAYELLQDFREGRKHRPHNKVGEERWGHKDGVRHLYDFSKNDEVQLVGYA